MAYILGDIAVKVQTRVRDTGYSLSTNKDFLNDTQNAIFNEYDLRFMESSQAYTLGVGVQDLTNGTGLPANFVSPINLQITTSFRSADGFAFILLPPSCIRLLQCFWERCFLYESCLEAADNL